MREPSTHGGEAAVPTHCPTCQSHDITTTSKVINSSTYWRCGACGEVWNAGRRQAQARYGSRHGYYR